MNFNAIDISYCQTGINPTVDNRIQYVVVKASQKNFKDPQFDNHMAKIGTKCNMGFYHFLDCKTVKEATEQAKFFLSVIEPYKAYTPYVFLDCEVYTMSYMLNMSKTLLTDICVAFLKECEKAGYTACLYTNLDHMENRLIKTKIEGVYPIWLANYGTTKPKYKNTIMWQYGIGKVQGFAGDVDLDIHYFSEEELAIMELARKGFFVCPAYWIKQCKKIDYLGAFFIKANKIYKYRWKQSQKVEWAISKLNKDGVISSPNYWKAVAAKNKNVQQLLLNFGGGVM